MKKCQENGCNSLATEEWYDLCLCEEHYFWRKSKYPSEWESLIEG